MNWWLIGGLVLILVVLVVSLIVFIPGSGPTVQKEDTQSQDIEKDQESPVSAVNWTEMRMDTAQPSQFNHYVKPSTALIDNEKFGAFAVTDDWLAVGASGWSNSKGRVFMFKKTGVEWTQTQVISHGQTDAFHEFGHSVAFDKVNNELYVLAPMTSVQQSCVYKYELEDGKWKSTTEHRSAQLFSRHVLLANDGWVFMSLEDGGIHCSHPDWSAAHMNPHVLVPNMKVMAAQIIDDEHIIVTGERGTKLVNILTGDIIKTSTVGGHAVVCHGNLIFVANSTEEWVSAINKTNFEDIDHAELPGSSMGIHTQSGFGTSLDYDPVKGNLYIAAPFEDISIRQAVGCVYIYNWRDMVFHPTGLYEPDGPPEDMMHYGKQIAIHDDKLVVSCEGFDKFKGALLCKNV